MNDNDPRHGTYAGHVAHSMSGIPMCEPCRTAATRYMKRRRLRVQNGEPLTVPRIGAQRRIQALMALGWTGTDIALACGWADRGSVAQILRPPDRGQLVDRGLRLTTHNTICAAYAQLSMRLPDALTPNRSRVRNMARRKGWPPPLAWDDATIDDPDAKPQGTARKKPLPRAHTDIDPVLIQRLLEGDWSLATKATNAERREICRLWSDAGRSIPDLETLTGWAAHRYWKATAA